MSLNDGILEQLLRAKAMKQAPDDYIDDDVFSDEETELLNHCQRHEQNSADCSRCAQCAWSMALYGNQDQKPRDRSPFASLDDSIMAAEEAKDREEFLEKMSEQSILNKVLKSSPRDNEANLGGGGLKRSNSVPDLTCSPPVPMTPNVQKAEGQLLTPVVPCHGRNYSCPVTTPDGKPVLLPVATPSSAASRERLIDLTEEDPAGSVGHRRKVLIMALPDLVDEEGMPGFVEESDELEDDAVEEESEARDTLAPFLRPIRPAWTRPRAYSVDVTMEVEIEVGRDLRRIADEFSRTAAARERAEGRTLWGCLKKLLRHSVRVGMVSLLSGSSSSFIDQLSDGYFSN